ncbi:MAG: hypothetical protein Q8941_01390 [Bacteroidota bacterium]|nr:hypothetical protein [Bacteroidota bacterium]
MNQPGASPLPGLFFCRISSLHLFDSIIFLILKSIKKFGCMEDPEFIKQMTSKGKEASEKVNANFADLSFSQLNWKPAPGSWRIGQCPDHLIVSDCLYFPA